MKISTEEFNVILENRLTLTKSVLGSKGKEYTLSDDNRIHNFNIAGMRRGITPEKALDGMMLKHEVSVYDMINYVETNLEKLTIKLIDEKIGDNINYLILLEAMLKKRVELYLNSLKVCNSDIKEEKYNSIVDDSIKGKVVIG